MSIKIFISSVQSEFAEARRRLSEYIKSDALLGKYFEPYIFEELPARNSSPACAYISEAQRSDIYLGIYGEKYGYEDEQGVSPTEREFEAATAFHRYRIVFVADKTQRHPKEAAFIAKIEQDVVRKKFVGFEDLKASVYAALVRYLEEKEYLRLLPFDASYNKEATLDDIDEDKVAWFVERAKRKRGFPLSLEDGVEKILRQLNLLSPAGRLTNAALLLFAKNPQRFFVSSEVKCAQFYSTRVTKPIASYQVAHGNVFEMIDQAVAFVMSKINAEVGSRHLGPEVDVEYEIPMEAVTESIVNAVTHRDYTSHGCVQVMLFSDRVEIWSPGRLPYGLTVAKLMDVHPSIPVNPLLANPIYLAGYIERLGTGTGDIISICKQRGLSQPVFAEDEDFKVTLYRKNVQSLAEDVQSLAENVQSSAENVQGLAETTKAKLSKKQQEVLAFCRNSRTSSEIMEHLGIKRNSRTIRLYINDLVALGLLRPLVSDKRTSPNQQYVAIRGENE